MSSAFETFYGVLAQICFAALGLWWELAALPADGFEEKAAGVLAKWKALPDGSSVRYSGMETGTWCSFRVKKNWLSKRSFCRADASAGKTARTGAC